jgi:hypothetical protein
MREVGGVPSVCMYVKCKISYGKDTADFDIAETTFWAAQGFLELVRIVLVLAKQVTFCKMIRSLEAALGVCNMDVSSLL